MNKMAAACPFRSYNLQLNNGWDFRIAGFNVSLKFCSDTSRTHSIAVHYGGAFNVQKNALLSRAQNASAAREDLSASQPQFRKILLQLSFATFLHRLRRTMPSSLSQSPMTQRPQRQNTLRQISYPEKENWSGSPSKVQVNGDAKNVRIFSVSKCSSLDKN